MADKPTTVDEYVAALPDDVRERIVEIRRRLLLAVPGAEEKVRYGMPAVMLGGRYAIHYAAWKKHIGLYPVATADGELESRIAPFRSGADSVNFPLNEPVPYDLVEEIGRFCASRRTP